jgi:hypothetical protein
VPNDCDIRDVVVLARDAAALAPGAAQVCASAESCASDPDGDYVCGSVDNCPTVANANQVDTDGDGLGDACDTCPTDVANDPDADGVCDPSIPPRSANPAQTNTDGDAGDDCDPDDDGDNVFTVATTPVVAESRQRHRRGRSATPAF